MRFILFVFLSFFTIASAAEKKEYFTSPQFNQAQIGIYIEDLKEERVVYSYNEDLFFIPSSLQKVPTTIAALSMFGKDYRFITKLEYEGKIDKKGVLHGNIWIKGGGDPTLSLSIINDWDKELKNLGILKIDGQIILDPTCFESALSSPQWFFEDLGNYYGAGACGLTINQNMYQVTFKPGNKEGAAATVVKTFPAIQNVSYINEVTTGPAKSGDQVWVFGSEYSNLQYLRGTVPIDSPTFTIKAAIPDPVSFLGEELNKKWAPTKGFKIIREKEKVKATKLIKQYASIPLKEMIIDMNLYSINLYAEHLLKLVGDGTSTKGRRYIEQLLSSWDIPSQVRDGSGVARTNLITPKGFVTILKKIRKSPYFDLIDESLPEASKKGSLASFPLLKNGRLRAKTGAMSNIYNLGGYVTANNGKEYAFAVFCNHHLSKRKEIEKEIKLILDTVIDKE